MAKWDFSQNEKVKRMKTKFEVTAPVTLKTALGMLEFGNRFGHMEIPETGLYTLRFENGEIFELKTKTEVLEKINQKEIE